MAAAQVSGAAALILSVKPELTAAQLKTEILNSVDKLPSLKGKVRTEGRLDVAKALPGAVTDLSPSSGPAVGGTSVTITGAQSEHGRPRSGSARTTPPASRSTRRRSITATSPAGTGTVDVTVTSPGGTSATNAGDQFSYETGVPSAPTVTGVSPRQRAFGRGHFGDDHRHQLQRSHRRSRSDRTRHPPSKSTRRPRSPPPRPRARGPST